MGAQHSFEDLKVGTFIDMDDLAWTRQVMRITPTQALVASVVNERRDDLQFHNRSDVDGYLADGSWRLVDAPTEPAASFIAKRRRKAMWAGAGLAFLAAVVLFAVVAAVYGYCHRVLP